MDFPWLDVCVWFGVNRNRKWVFSYVNNKHLLFIMHGMDIKVTSKSICHKSGELSSANLHQINQTRLYEDLKVYGVTDLIKMCSFAFPPTATVLHERRSVFKPINKPSHVQPSVLRKVLKTLRMKKFGIFLVNVFASPIY